MTFSGEEKSLSAWRLELKKFGKPHWSRFYQEFLGREVSNFPRFYRDLKLYGEWAMFEAIVTSSGADLTGDPLFYVLKVAQNKWKEEQEALEEEEQYEDTIQKSIEETAKRNAALEKRLAGKRKRKYTKRVSL